MLLPQQKKFLDTAYGKKKQMKEEDETWLQTLSYGQKIFQSQFA